ncbi:MAG: carboxypeptidase-like regulatory domain-containing protein [Crocinitomicaceae bacterium]|nr:carboxypeptidase-like regulatory domain-containing protein [Crocinitomicaceae bacterium]
MKTTTLLLFLLAISSVSYGQVLKGTISDEQGNSLPFSKVWLKNTSFGTIANGKGEYQLEVQKHGAHEIRISQIGYLPMDTIITVNEDVFRFNVVLKSSIQDIEEVKVTSLNKRKKGKNIMKQVIDHRKSFLESASRYECETYCFTTLDKRTQVRVDSLLDSTALSMSKMNITEWNGTSYFHSKNRYKDIITGFIDYTEKVKNSSSVSVSFSDDELGEAGASVEGNPYIFVNGIQDADINIFKNFIDAPSISQRPIISPLSYNAFVYYNFYLEGSFMEGDQMIYEIRVDPIFAEEALFTGTLYIRSVSFEPKGYELAVNKGAMDYFKELRIICNYERVDRHLVPVKREFVYLIQERNFKDGKFYIHGNSRVSHDNYKFDYDDNGKRFWLETQVYQEEAFNREADYWEGVRPFYLEQEEIEFIRIQDSIMNHLESEEYLAQQDSIYNTLNVWDFLFNGVGFRNTFKKQEIWFSPLLEQVVPFGVGGYRHKLAMSYEKEFKNGHAIDISPEVDLGFNNMDLKGRLRVGYTYNPKRFAHASLSFGDTYDFINGYESVQGTLAPSNRVRNQKVKINHQFEIVNGLYFRTSLEYSKRQAIENIEYPDWVSVFGTFQEPVAFDDYSIFLVEGEFSYRIRQKYIMRGKKKIVTGAKWPLLKLKYRKGIPNIFDSQSDFDFLQIGMSDRISFNSLGNSEIEVVAGAFLRKSNLRPIENKYFRTSDSFFFSDPTKSMQMLDTSLNTSNQYLQANFIHHFNGFFLDKIWGLNKLGLEETIGGGLLMIPESNFNQVEFYVGLERKLRIKKQLFKIGIYAVASDNNFEKATIRWKIGVNFYDSFRKIWDY